MESGRLVSGCNNTMDYITVRAASLKWGVSARQVQSLCVNGKIPGTIRFNRSWAIPADAHMPPDGRKNESHPVQEGSILRSNEESIELDHFKEIFNRFPYSINITTADGIMIYANDAFFEGVLHDAREHALGSYNILQEEMLEKWGLTEHVKSAFRGEKVFTPGLEFPNRSLIGTKYGKDYAFFTLYNDITSFPIFNPEGQLRFVVSIFIPVRRFTAREEVARAKAYIETHWREPFRTINAAQAANMSLSAFLSVFKKETGFTPHAYYIEIKMMHLKEILMDGNQSISQAFNECGMDYNSYYTSLFKTYTGMTPKQFRRK